MKCINRNFNTKIHQNTKKLQFVLRLFNILIKFHSIMFKRKNNVFVKT